MLYYENVFNQSFELDIRYMESLPRGSAGTKCQHSLTLFCEMKTTLLAMRGLCVVKDEGLTVCLHYVYASDFFLNINRIIFRVGGKCI